MHVMGNVRGRHLIILANPELLGVWFGFFDQVWKACHTHRYRGINNTLSNLEPWPGSSRSKPTKKTCTIKRKEKRRQGKKATDKQMRRTKESAPLQLHIPPSAREGCPRLQTGATFPIQPLKQGNSL